MPQAGISVLQDREDAKEQTAFERWWRGSEAHDGSQGDHAAPWQATLWLTGVSVMGHIRGPSVGARVKNTRKLLIWAALMMCTLLLGANFVATVLIPQEAFVAGDGEPAGEASGRALSWLVQHQRELDRFDTDRDQRERELLRDMIMLEPDERQQRLDALFVGEQERFRASVPQLKQLPHLILFE